MALQSDSQGFLVGDSVDLSRVIDQFRQIRQDVADIKRSMLGAVANVNRNSRSSSEGSNARNQDLSTSGQSSASNSGAATPNRPRGRNGSSDGLPPVNPNGTVTPNGRGHDASGRFAGNGQPGNQEPNPTDTTEEDKKQRNLLGGFADRIATAVTATTAGDEEADPTIKAFQEVAEPMRRGYEIFTGGGDKKDRWYKKIFKELNLFRKDETAFNRAANRSLHNIENTPGGGDSGGSGGGFLGGAGALMLGAKALLRKVPILGALLGGIGAFGDVSSTEGNNSLTRGEKDRRNGKAIGGAVGTFGGMMAGAKLGATVGALGGPVGAAIGGVAGGAAGLFFGDQAGQIIGEKMGEWTTQLRDADVPGKIIGAWETTTSAIKSGWDGALKLMSSAWDKTKEVANAANDFVKDKTGVDVKAELKNAHQNLVNFTANEIIPPLADLTNKGADKLKQGAEWAGENTTVGKGAKAAWNGAKSVTHDLLDTERKHRSKKGNAETAMKVLMDKGWSKEQAAGIAANLAAESGFDTNAVGDSGKAKGIAQWHPDRQKKFEEVNGKKLSDATFEEQVGFVDWELNNTEKKAGDKIRTAATAEQAAAFTEQKYERSALGLKGGVQPERIGAASKYANLDIVEETPKPETPSVMPSLVDDPTQGGRYKYEKLEGGTVQVTDSQDGTISLASDEQANAFRKQEGKQYLDKVAAINANDIPAYYNLAAGPVNTQVQTASATSPRVPTFAPPPAIGEAPPVIQPLASDSNRNLTVNMPTPDVGQDVRDRGIAHIVTGGLSGRG